MVGLAKWCVQCHASLCSLHADFVDPHHWNLFKFKIWHAKGMVWTISIVPTVGFDCVGSVGGVVGPDGQPSGTGTGLLKMPVTAVMTHNIGVNSIPEAQEGHWIVRERCERMSGDVATLFG